MQAVSQLGLWCGYMHHNAQDGMHKLPWFQRAAGTTKVLVSVLVGVSSKHALIYQQSRRPAWHPGTQWRT